MIENIMDYPWLTFLVLVGFLLDWLAIACKWKKLKPFTKLLAMVLLIGWTLIASGWKVDLFVGFLLLAQIFGLVGDAFLLFSKRWFLCGLVSFLLGHLSYLGLLVLIVVRQHLLDTLWGMTWYGIACAVIWAGIMTGLYLIFRPPFKRAHNSVLWLAVQVYIWILSAMVIGTIWITLSQSKMMSLSLFLPVGGMLFLLSDSILAYDRFVEKLNYAQLSVRITYHMAQLCLAIGLLFLHTKV